MLLELLFYVLSLITVGTADFGYELAVSRLDAIDSKMQEDRLRSRQQFQSLGSEIVHLRRTISDMITRQSTSQASLEVQLKNVETEQEKLSGNMSRLLNYTGEIQRMMHDFFLKVKAGQLQAECDSKKVPFAPQKLPRDCVDVPDRRTGVQKIYPSPGFNDSFDVFCDQDYKGGGWTVIQKRYNGSISFDRDWNEYENGFGDLRGEFWLGLSKIHMLTQTKRHELHIIMETVDGNVEVAKYDHFLVGGSEVQFTLESLGKYSGTAGDSLRDAIGMRFRTRYMINGKKVPLLTSGGWWNMFHNSNLNNFFIKHLNSNYGAFIKWESSGLVHKVKSPRMMIRAVNPSLR